MREEYIIYDSDGTRYSQYDYYGKSKSYSDLLKPKKKSTKEILDGLDFKEIEQYVRQKKLQNIENK